MRASEKFSIVAFIIAAVFTVLSINILIWRMTSMTDAKYTLVNYTGVGSGVYKHGTIVKVVDGQPVVVGHFDDDSGAEYPGTLEIKEAK
jgi:hypothetical protein